MDPNMPHVRIYETVNTNRIRVEDVRKTPRCRMSESIQLYAQMSHASSTRRCQLSEYTQLLTHFDAARDQSPLDDASLERPRMQ